MADWLFYKRFISGVDVKIILYGSFTTIISILVLRSNIIEKQINTISKIDPTQLTQSIILFFISGIIWFLVSIFCSICIPHLIRDHNNATEYLEKIKKTVSINETWEPVEQEHSEIWKAQNTINKITHSIIFIGLSLSLVCYIFALHYFFGAVSLFLEEIFL
tara:strand:- start:312 stop:797 length:486 start_codon:yes stop_codon:yes gene_type:complete